MAHFCMLPSYLFLRVTHLRLSLSHSTHNIEALGHFVLKSFLHIIPTWLLLAWLVTTNMVDNIATTRQMKVFQYS